MSHIFILQPNFALLNKYGYLSLDPNQLHAAIKNRESVSVEVEAIWTEEKRISTETAFSTLLERYGLSTHYHTLLFILLVKSNEADLEFQHKFNIYENHKREKELAQCLMLFHPDARHKPNNIKLMSPIAEDSVKLTDHRLINWIGSLIREAVEAGNFNPTELGDSIFSFIADDAGNINSTTQGLNYNNIRATANHTVRKPGIRERNKMLAKFLSKVLTFLNGETNLKARDGVRFSDDQLNFLFRTAVILEWLVEDGFESEPKDYIYTLLSNQNIF